MFTSWVILALVKGDRRTRVEVVEQVKKNMGEFFRIENRLGRPSLRWCFPLLDVERKA